MPNHVHRNAVNIPYRELDEYLEKKQDQKYRFSFDGKDTVICHNREVQDHLIHLCLTVSAYCIDLVFSLI